MRSTAASDDTLDNSHIDVGLADALDPGHRWTLVPCSSRRPTGQSVVEPQQGPDCLFLFFLGTRSLFIFYLGI
jgi:hypothetical protein